ncbi:hypothetical protein EAF04_008905 [Stromatinia cepivora]|nr:hypothetical protein EAF04_008905 [Stromatinia cepivora]
MAAKTESIPVELSSEKVLAPDNNAVAGLADDLSACSLSESITTTSSKKKSPGITSQDTSPLLDILPVEIITKILKMACTTSTSHETLQLCALRIKNEKIYSSGRCCLRNPSKASPKCPEIQTYKALTMTCAIFRDIIDTSDLLFKHNTFAFCSFQELAILKALTPKKRNAISSIYLCHKWDLFQCIDSERQSNSFDTWAWYVSRIAVREGYHIIASCHGLCSLTINIDESTRNSYSYWHLEKLLDIFCRGSASEIKALSSICGLQNFYLMTTNTQHMRSSDSPYRFVEMGREEDNYFCHFLGTDKEDITEEFKHNWYSKIFQMEQKLREIVTRPRLES